MTSKFADDTIFTQGACRYKAKPASSGSTYVRPFLSVLVEGQLVEAAIDTGGYFLILNPEIADLIGLSSVDGDASEPIVIRGQKFSGHLHRVDLTFEAQQGEPLTVEVTALVPEGEWDFPNFLGWPFCLECLRFAFAPDVESHFSGNWSGGWFHFGKLENP